jgi:RNA polymerase sigma-70 factor (ECF subfamily)
MKEKNSIKLIHGPLKSDLTCFDQVFRNQKSKVTDYIRRYIRDADLVEDILQETFLKVFQSLKENKYTDNGKFLSWVMRIAHNLIIDHFRSKKQMNTISNDNCEADLFNLKIFAEDNIEDKMIKRQIHLDVRTIVNHLPEDQKEVIVLRFYNGLSFKEIAEITDISINTALGRMRYALINLRKIMAEKEISLAVN